MLKIKVNDKVIVLKGKDKKKISIVSKIIKKKKLAVLEGINLCKKHSKPVPNKDKHDGILKIEKPLHLSNIALINSSSKKKDKVKFKFIKNKKFRIFRSNGEIINWIF